MTESHMLGVDIGGSAIKARIVDVLTGELVTERTKRTTPALSHPHAVASTFASLIAEIGWDGPLATTFPGVICDDIVQTANNLESSWIGTDAAHLFSDAVALPVTVLNDADAAALAEARFGAATDEPGVSIVVTLGTGIGTGLLVGGKLAPNTELGQLLIDGSPAEQFCSSAARVRDQLSFEAFGERLHRYLSRLSDLIRPNLIIVGGGISRDFDQYGHLLDLAAPVIPAAFRNEAGIVGAALAAAREPGQSLCHA